MHLVGEPVTIQRLAQLGVELRAGHVGPERDMEVVRPQLDAVAHRRGEDERAAALEAPDLDDRAGCGVASEPVEQRSLVDLQRSDAVVQLVRREEERKILETVQAVGPARDVREPHRRGVRQDRRVDQVLAGRGAAGAAHELLQVEHGADATATCAGRPTHGAGPPDARAAEPPNTARAPRRQRERGRRRPGATRKRQPRARHRRAPQRPRRP